jgi:carbon monoxide dehydrogenase subunit G
MPELTIVRRIATDPAVVWSVLDDFGDIARWSPGVKHSILTSEGPVGLGSTRHCDFVPMGQVNERIEGYELGRSMTIRLYDFVKMPLSDATAAFHLVAEGGETRLTFHCDFTPNLVGRVFGRALEKQMRKGLERLVDGLQREAERQVTS